MAGSVAASADASVAASANNEEEVAKNVGGGSGSTAAGMRDDCSAASLDLGGDDFIETAFQGMGGGGSTAEPSVMAPMPDVLGDYSSGSEGEGTGDDDASPPREEDATSADRRHPMVVPLMEVSEDEAEVSSPAAALEATTRRPEDAGTSGAVLSPLHLGELHFVFAW